MKKVIRLTESDLHRIIKESVERVLNEGQGWNMFKASVKDANNATDDEWRDYEDYDPEEFKQDKANFIKYGSWMKDDKRPFYDDRGNSTYDDTGNRIKKGYLGQLGRWAGINAGKAYIDAAHGLRNIRKGLQKGYDKVFN